MKITANIIKTNREMANCRDSREYYKRYRLFGGVNGIFKQDGQYYALFETNGLEAITEAFYNTMLKNLLEHKLA